MWAHQGLASCWDKLKHTQVWIVCSAVWVQASGDTGTMVKNCNSDILTIEQTTVSSHATCARIFQCRYKKIKNKYDFTHTSFPLKHLTHHLLKVVMQTEHMWKKAQTCMWWTLSPLTVSWSQLWLWCICLWCSLRTPAVSSTNKDKQESELQKMEVYFTQIIKLTL